MPSNTYILLSRSILNSEVFASQKLLKIWIWCLCKANYKDRFISLKVGRGERTIKVKRGQFLFGRFKAEEELFIDGSTIYKIMKKLEQLGNISIKSNNQYSIVTICNYNTYQDSSKYKVATKEQPKNNQRTAKSQPSNINNNINKVNNENKKEEFITWLDYRKSLKKPITVEVTLDSLVKRFNTEPIEKIKWVIDHSIQNGYQGLFWNKYKKDNPVKKREITGYQYDCYHCRKSYKFEKSGTYRCTENGCQIEMKDKKIVGAKLDLIKTLHKEDN